MGLFKKFKEALPTIGAAVGFAFTGNPALGAAIGGGLGSLAAGKSVEDSLKNAALAGVAGYGATQIGFGAGDPGLGRFKMAPPTTALPTGSRGSGAFLRTGEATSTDGGLGSLLTPKNLAIGAGGLGLLGALVAEEEEETGGFRYPDTRPGEATGVLVGRSGTRYDVDDPEDMKRYADEMRQLQDPGYDYYTDPYRPVARSSGFMSGGEVNGPGTGTSDSVPARLSDGEFVLTAKAVRGAGGGDRDIGAARLYDMMSELEATA